MVARWVAWASEVVQDWPDDIRDAPYDVAAAEKAVRVAEHIVDVLAVSEV
jgi:hypothetical protein